MTGARLRQKRVVVSEESVAATRVPPLRGAVCAEAIVAVAKMVRATTVQRTRP
jgi:hypothetical protein